MVQRIRFNKDKYNFEKYICKMLGVDDLSRLHEFFTYKDTVFERAEDQSTQMHKTYYDKFEDGFGEVYRKFIAEFILPQYEGDIGYQAIPTFRVHLPGNVAVGEFHKDSTYGHQPKEQNYILPFTTSGGTACTWCESEPGKGDYQPIQFNVGELVKFDGANLEHGNKPNDTGLTRVSVDFRVIPVEDLVETDAASINTNVPFQIGGYYALMRHNANNPA